GPARPAFDVRGGGGTFPIVAWRRGGAVTWGIEAVMLSAGSAVEWLRDDLGLISSAAESDAVAAACTDTGDVWFVPALLGLGPPRSRTRSSRGSRPRGWGSRSSRAWPSARGRTRTTWRPRGSPLPSSRRPAHRDASAGWRRGNVPARGCRSCRRSTSEG